LNYFFDDSGDNSRIQEGGNRKENRRGADQANVKRSQEWNLGTRQKMKSGIGLPFQSSRLSISVLPIEDFA
jgi:hypothetical protein